MIFIISSIAGVFITLFLVERFSDRRQRREQRQRPRRR